MPSLFSLLFFIPIVIQVVAGDTTGIYIIFLAASPHLLFAGNLVVNGNCEDTSLVGWHNTQGWSCYNYAPGYTYGGAPYALFGGMSFFSCSVKKIPLILFVFLPENMVRFWVT